MKYFREDESPSARLPNTFMQGFLEVSLVTVLYGLEFDGGYVRVEIDRLIKFSCTNASSWIVYNVVDFDMPCNVAKIRIVGLLHFTEIPIPPRRQTHLLLP